MSILSRISQIFLSKWISLMKRKRFSKWNNSMFSPRWSRNCLKWFIVVQTKRWHFYFNSVSQPLIIHWFNDFFSLLAKSGLQLHEQTTLRSITMFTVKSKKKPRFEYEFQSIFFLSRISSNTPNQILGQQSFCNRTA